MNEIAIEIAMKINKIKIALMREEGHTDNYYKKIPDIFDFLLISPFRIIATAATLYYNDFTDNIILYELGIIINYLILDTIYNENNKCDLLTGMEILIELDKYKILN